MRRTREPRGVIPTTVGVLISIGVCVSASVLVGWALEASPSNAPGLTVGIAATGATAAGLALLLAWLARRGVTWRDSPRLAPLWSALAGRRGLLVGYGALIFAWAWLCVQLSVWIWPELLANAFGNSGTFFGWDFEGSSNDVNRVFYNWLSAAVFLLLQGAFLWSGGKLRIGTAPSAPYRLAVSVAIFGLLMSLVTTGFFVAVLEAVDRFSTNGRFGESGPSDAVFGVLLLATWSLWLPIAWFATRDVDRPTGLSRLVGILLAGSWIEFAVAMPIELIKRGRHESCPCESGSWLALVITGPLLLWSLGPAVYLLYLRERALDARHPGHAKRILARKSTKVKSGAQLT